MKVVLATRNQGKIREFQKRFSEIGWEVIPIADIADIPEPEETGTTFRENALQKARYYAEAVNLPVLSDDSGIIADVLGNEPGVYSARYAGVHGNDEANKSKTGGSFASLSRRSTPGTLYVRDCCRVAQWKGDYRGRQM